MNKHLTHIICQITSCRVKDALYLELGNRFFEHFKIKTD